MVKSYIVGFLFVVASGCNNISHGQEPTYVKPDIYFEESKEAFDKRMFWWRNAKFGMFIHWGPYAVLGGEYKENITESLSEWIMNNENIPIGVYENYARKFNANDFDAVQWVRLAKEAGMKYLIITAKHHDGFCLWDSKVSSYDIVDHGNGPDILEKLSKACKQNGIRFGIYYSIMDWHHPDAQAINEPRYWSFNEVVKPNPRFDQYLEHYMKPQIKELIEGYDPAIMWFDGEWIPEYTHEHGKTLYHYIRTLKPSIIINNRVDKGRQGMSGMNKEGFFAGDFGTPEQEILERTSSFDWESCMTINGTWGYNKHDNNWKSSSELIQNLVDITAKGGNYLLNVGPTGSGTIPEPSIVRLKDIGEWIKTNGQGIYGTIRHSDYKQGDSIRFTKNRNNDTIYAFKLGDIHQSLTIHKIVPKKGSSIYLLGLKEPLEWSYSEEAGLRISIPNLDIVSTWWKTWTLKISKVDS